MGEGDRAVPIWVWGVASACVHAVAGIVMLEGVAEPVGSLGGVVMEGASERVPLGDPSADAVGLTWLGVEPAVVGTSGVVSDTVQARQERAVGGGEPGAAGRLVAAAGGAPAAAVEAVRAEVARLASGAAAVGAAADRLAGVLSAAADAAEAEVVDGSAASAVVEGAGDSSGESEGEDSAAEPKEVVEPVEVASGSGGDGGGTGGAAGAGSGGGSGGGGEPSAPPATQSDREAPATQVEAKDLGQPLSVAGLRIVTQRPSRSVYSEITTGRARVTIRISFDGTGKAALVEVVESSGYSSVDSPVVNAAYEWRAIGRESGPDSGGGGYTLPKTGVSLTFVIRL